MNATTFNGRVYAYAIKEITPTQLVQELSGSSESKWQELIDYCLASYTANCIHTSDDYRKRQLPAGQFFASSKAMKDMIGKNTRPYYSDYLQVLQRLGIIWPLVDGKDGYQVGISSKIYCFNDADYSVTSIQLYDRKLVKKTLKRIEREIVDEQQDFSDTHRILAVMLQKVVLPNYEEVLKSIKFKGKDEADVEKRRKAFTMVCRQMMEETYQHRVTLSPNNRRLNTIIVRMKREVRKKMHFRDDMDTPMIEKDASNSQLWCFTTLNSDHILKFIARHFPEQTADIIKLFSWLERQPDYQAFKYLAERGMLYESIVEQVNRDVEARYWQRVKYHDGMDESPTLRQYTRNYIKTKAMKLLFGNDVEEGTQMGRYRYQNPHYVKSFSKLFPSVNKAFVYLRKKMSKSGFACMMQAVESHIWLDGISTLLIESGADDFFTCHDAISLKRKPSELDLFDKVTEYYFREVLKVNKPLIK